MKSIVCLGKKACDIGECFEAYSETPSIKLIDVDIEGDNCFSVPPQKTAEEYEKNTPDLSSFLSDINEEVLFIVSGESAVANCSLRILQQIKYKKISIAYILPQLEFLTAKQVMQEKVIRSVLQEYARSGVFHEMILFNANMVEGLIGETSIKDFDSEYNLTVVRLLRSYFYSNSAEKIIDQSSPPQDVSRIITFGYYDITSDSERCAYDLKFVTDKIYHFFLSEETLDGNIKGLRELKNKIKNKAVDNTRVSYTIKTTSGKTDHCFVIYYSKATQQ